MNNTAKQPKQAKRFRCDQCEASMINGVFCHEAGCSNSRKTWVAEREEWVRFVECRECGCDVEEGESCDCQEPYEGYLEQADFERSMEGEEDYDGCPHSHVVTDASGTVCHDCGAAR